MPDNKLALLFLHFCAMHGQTSAQITSGSEFNDQTVNLEDIVENFGDNNSSKNPTDIAEDTPLWQLCLDYRWVTIWFRRWTSRTDWGRSEWYTATFQELWTGATCKQSYFFLHILFCSQLVMTLAGFVANVATLIVLKQNKSIFTSVIRILLMNQSFIDSVACLFAAILIVQVGQTDCFLLFSVMLCACHEIHFFAQCWQTGVSVHGREQEMWFESRLGFWCCCPVSTTVVKKTSSSCSSCLSRMHFRNPCGFQTSNFWLISSAMFGTARSVHLYFRTISAQTFATASCKRLRSVKHQFLLLEVRFVLMDKQFRDNVWCYSVALCHTKPQ